MKIDYDNLYRRLQRTNLSAWNEILPQAIKATLDPQRYGNLPRWQQALAELTPPSQIDRVDLQAAVAVSGSALEAHKQQLLQLKPWRKGPYLLPGVTIDTEWRSDWKWQRVLPHISDLTGRQVLDVGCGNGYHCWRMLGAGADLVIGTDPSPLFVCQFFALKNFIDNNNAWVLPFSLEELPPASAAFDSIFSMGVLYHRKSPLDHLERLKSYLRPGGELVLETLVVDGPQGFTLMPQDRYAKMRNVWFIPSTATLERWLERCGFSAIRVVDKNWTSCEEQRASQWMTFESLSDFLDPNDPTKTVEGYPAPQRAVVVAQL